MNEQEALTRVKTGNFNNGRGFDMQLLVDAVGIIGEMLKSGQLREVVCCKNCSEYKAWGTGKSVCGLGVIMEHARWRNGIRLLTASDGTDRDSEKPVK